MKRFVGLILILAFALGSFAVPLSTVFAFDFEADVGVQVNKPVTVNGVEAIVDVQITLKRPAGLVGEVECSKYPSDFMYWDTTDSKCKLTASYLADEISSDQAAKDKAWATYINAAKKFIDEHGDDENFSADNIRGNGLNYASSSLGNGSEIRIYERGNSDSITDAVAVIPFEINIFEESQVRRVFIGTDAKLKPDTEYVVNAYLYEVLDDVFHDTETVRGPELVPFTTKAVTGQQNTTTTTSGTVGGGSVSSGELAPPAVEEPACGIGVRFLGGTESSVAGCIAQIIYFLVYQPVMFFLTLAGNLLDYALDFTTDRVSYTASDFVDEGWKVTRDIANIFFILVLLYTGISTVLDIGHFDWKRMIGKIILVALLINFSLFFTKVIIDSSNILARVFYNGITVVDDKGQDAALSRYSQRKSISVAISDQLKIEKLASGWTDGTLKIINLKGEVTTLNGSGYAAMYILMLLGSIVAGAVALWTFFIVAFLLIGRVVGLWIAMIMAPIAFISHILPHGLDIPGLGWKKWWGDLLGLCFLAPIFFFFLYLIVKFLQTEWLTAIFTKADTNGTQDMIQVAMAILVPFLITITLLNRSRKLAQEYAGEAGGAIVKGATAMAGFAAGGALGAVALGGGRVIGTIASSVASKDGVQKAATQKISGINLLARSQRSLARMTLKGADKAMNSSFDARNTGIAKSLSGAAGIKLDNAGTKFLGLGGDKTKGGWKAFEHRDQEKWKKNQEIYYKGTFDKEESIQKESKEIQKNYANITKGEKNLATYKNDLENLNRKLNDANTSPEEKIEVEAKIGEINVKVKNENENVALNEAKIAKSTEKLAKNGVQVDKNTNYIKVIEDSKKRVTDMKESYAGELNRSEGAILGDSLISKNTVRMALAGSVVGPVGTIAAGLVGVVSDLITNQLPRGDHHFQEAIRTELTKEKSDKDKFFETAKKMFGKEGEDHGGDDHGGDDHGGGGGGGNNHGGGGKSGGSHGGGGHGGGGSPSGSSHGGGGAGAGHGGGH